MNIDGMTKKNLIDFCKEKFIIFNNFDSKDILKKKVQDWQEAHEVKIKKSKEVIKEKVYNAKEFGQIYRLDKPSIIYLIKHFSNTTQTINEWVGFCKKNKVID